MPMPQAPQVGTGPIARGMQCYMWRTDSQIGARSGADEASFRSLTPSRQTFSTAAAGLTPTPTVCPTSSRRTLREGFAVWEDPLKGSPSAPVLRTTPVPESLTPRGLTPLLVLTSPQASQTHQNSPARWALDCSESPGAASSEESSGVRSPEIVVHTVASLCGLENSRPTGMPLLLPSRRQSAKSDAATTASPASPAESISLLATAAVAASEGTVSPPEPQFIPAEDEPSVTSPATEPTLPGVWASAGSDAAVPTTPLFGERELLSSLQQPTAAGLPGLQGVLSEAVLLQVQRNSILLRLAVDEVARSIEAEERALSVCPGSI